jgi:hypothetical protein
VTSQLGFALAAAAEQRQAEVRVCRLVVGVAVEHPEQRSDRQIRIVA